MEAVSYSTVRANLAWAMDSVCANHDAMIITRSGHESAVLLSLEDFRALEETAYLLRNPTNASRLLAATQQLDSGKGKKRKLAQ